MIKEIFLMQDNTLLNEKDILMHMIKYDGANHIDAKWKKKNIIMQMKNIKLYY